MWRVDYGLIVCGIFQLEAKYEIEKEQEARLWIEEVIGEPLDEVVLHLHRLLWLWLHELFNLLYV